MKALLVIMLIAEVSQIKCDQRGLVDSLSCRVPADVIDRLELIREARYSHSNDGEILES